MNIGIVTTWFERGAAYVSKAYMETLRKEHQVFVYARAGERYAIGNPLWDLPNVYWGKKVPGKIDTYVDWSDFEKWIKKCNINLILFNEQQSWDIVVRCRRKLNIPLASYIDYYTPETVPFFWLFDFLVCNTRRHYSIFDSHPNASYIPWGTNLDLFMPTPRSAKHITFFHSCGMDPFRKGTELVLKAFHQLQGHARLIVHSQIPLPESCIVLTEREDIEIHIQDISAPGLYHLGDVYVYPTRLEGIGLTITEALACGLPVITTDEAPMNEFVIHQLNGRLIRVQQHLRRWDNYYWSESIPELMSLVEQMQYYVDEKSQIETFRRATRNDAMKHLNWSLNSRGLCSLLRHVKRVESVNENALCQQALVYDKRRYAPLWKKVFVKFGAKKIQKLLKN
jgi:glycosyltransferase involved in cell wall biosynthesis